MLMGKILPQTKRFIDERTVSNHFSLSKQIYCGNLTIRLDGVHVHFHFLCTILNAVNYSELFLITLEKWIM
jgi:hypothetical protein